MTPEAHPRCISRIAATQGGNHFHLTQSRYTENRKQRSAENNIRYTSRKLYAGNQRRFNGRFARPDELEAYLKQKEARRKQEGGQFLRSH